MHWRVGNGLNVKFWTDVWLPDMGMLQSFAICDLSIDQLQEKVCDYWCDRDWNLQKLEMILPGFVVNRIFSMFIANNCSVEDSMIWGLTKNGEFSVTSAYGSHFMKDAVDNWKCKFHLEYEDAG